MSKFLNTVGGRRGRMKPPLTFLQRPDESKSEIFGKFQEIDEIVSTMDVQYYLYVVKLIKTKVCNNGDQENQN